MAKDEQINAIFYDKDFEAELNASSIDSLIIMRREYFIISRAHHSWHTYM